MTGKGDPVVTGAGSGIGRTAVLKLLGGGFAVVATDLHREYAAAPARLAAEAEHAEAEHAEAEHAEAVPSAVVDVREDDQVAGAIAGAVDRFASLSCVSTTPGSAVRSGR